MSKKFTAFTVSIILLISASTFLADEKSDGEKSPALQEELENQQPGDLKEVVYPAEGALNPVVRRRVRALEDKQVEIDVVPRRIRADQPQPPVRQQAPARLRQFLRTHNRWFNALKDAYREGDMERIGRLIRRMEQFRKQMRNRMESAQQMRPLVRQGRRTDEGYQPQGRMRNFRGRLRNRGPVDEVPAIRRQLRQERRRRFRMQDMPDRQLQGPVAPSERGYCENCDCERCRQLRARPQRQLGRPGAEGRGPERFGQYGEGFRQGRLRQRRGQQQQLQPKEDVQENEELDFDWDW